MTLFIKSMYESCGKTILSKLLHSFMKRKIYPHWTNLPNVHKYGDRTMRRIAQNRLMYCSDFFIMLLVTFSQS